MVDYSSRLRACLPGADCCLLCRAGVPAGVAICDACDASLPTLRLACRFCALPLTTTDIDVCARCQITPPSFRNCIAAFRYAWPIDAMIHEFKDGGQLAIGRLLSAYLLAQLLQHYRPEEMPGLLIPVPLPSRRLRERGFNQALQIARQLGRGLRRPVAAERLSGKDLAAPQKSLRAQQRLQNMSGTFSVEGRLQGRIALIDDVVTTAATANAASRELLRAGADSVDVWCLARTPAPGQP